MATEILKIRDPNIMEHPRFHGEIAAFGTNPQWSTIGDLHGNVMLFLYFAAQRGAIEITPEDYHEIAEIYHHWEATPAQKARYRELLSKIDVAPNAKIRLIGDELCDRGMGDDLMLEAVDLLSNKEVILSNHTFVFIYHYEKAKKRAMVNGALNREKFQKLLIETPMEQLVGDYSASYQNMQYALKTGAITLDELEALYNRHKKYIKAFSYDYDTKGKLVIYSHAPVGKQTIIGIAEELEGAHLLTDDEKQCLKAVKEKKKLVDEDMIPLIDMINRVVTLKLDKDALLDITFPNEVPIALGNAFENPYDPLDNDINNVHGHVPDEHGEENRISLDGPVGRYQSSALDELHKKAKKNEKDHRIDVIYYTSSCPWQKNVPEPSVLNPDIPLVAQYARGEHKDCRWRITPQTIKTPILFITKPFEQENDDVPFENQINGLLFHPVDSENAMHLYGPDGWVLSPIRSVLFGGLLPVVNSVIDYTTFGWVEHKAAKALTFPLRIFGEAIKFPLMIMSGCAGMVMGTLAAIFSPPEKQPIWAPIMAGLADGIRPFAPNAATWNTTRILRSHDDYKSFSDVTKNIIEGARNESFSRAYLASFAIAALIISAIILASVLTGGGAGLGMIMPFVFGQLFGAPLVLSPVLAPLSATFGSAWLYISGTMLFGGLTKFLSGVIDGAAFVLGAGKEKQMEPMNITQNLNAPLINKTNNDNTHNQLKRNNSSLILSEKGKAIVINNNSMNNDNNINSSNRTMEIN